MVVHGLGGTPGSVRPLTEALTTAGYAVIAPLLPGHGTSADDLAAYGWRDWLTAVEGAVDELAATVDRIVIVGQSMGGTVALQLSAVRHEVSGVATINALALPADPDATEHLEYLLGRGRMMQRAADPDIRDPDAVDDSYSELPIRALLEMATGAHQVHDLLGDIAVDVFVVSSDHDGVVDPANSDAIAHRVRGPVTRLRLPNSGHVAALDLERVRLCRELLIWLADLTDGSATAV